MLNNTELNKTIEGPDGYRDFYYKRLEKNEEGFVKKVFINKAKEVYHEEY